jgi:hypothetical protein
MSTVILQPDTKAMDFDQSWEYRSLIGNFNFLEKSTRPDIAYTVHQCARYSASPHARAVRRMGRNLLSTRSMGLTYSPSVHSFNCWADSDFVGNWEKSIAMEDINTARHNQAILQTEIALSTTEAEYISLSTALREFIPLMNILSELKDQLDHDIIKFPTFHCKLFEDNSGAYELATTPKMHARTKHNSTSNITMPEHMWTKSGFH